MPHINLASLMALIFISSGLNAEEIPNYCKDAETNAHWESIAERAANIPDVVNLYTLRIELCKKVDNGGLTVREATELFEKERDRVVDTLQREKV